MVSTATVILEDFQVVGAGLSKWTIRRAGRAGVLHKRILESDLSRRRRPRQRENQGEKASPMCRVGHITEAFSAHWLRCPPTAETSSSRWTLSLGCQVLQGD